MRKIFFLLMVSELIFLTFCGSKNEEINLVVPEDYKSWKKPVDKILDYPIPGHGKSFRIIYANSNAYRGKTEEDYQGNKRFLYPEGTVFVKEIYMKKEDIGRKTPILSIMEKVNRKKSRSGWIFALKKPGKPVKIFKGKICVGCHESANEKHPYFDKNTKGIFRDYIFVPVKRQN